MTGRIRTTISTHPVVGDLYSPINGWTKVSASYNLSQTCTDEVGAYEKDNPFYLTKLVEIPRWFDGQVGLWKYKGVPLWSFTPPAHRIPDSLTTTELNQYAMQLLAKSNPNRPAVSVPTFVGELKDLPSLMKSSIGEYLYKSKKILDAYSAYGQVLKKGRAPIEGYGLPGLGYDPDDWATSYSKILRMSPEARSKLYWHTKKTFGGGGDPIGALSAKTASEYLAYRWAIRPLISDLQSMVGFSAAVEERLRWINHLADGRQLRIRKQLDTKSFQQALTPQGLWNQGCLIMGARTDTTRKRIWGTARWVPDGQTPTHVPLLDRERVNLARRQVLGLTPENITATAWELMPWSWLADWFTGFGNVFAAGMNHISVKPERICIMAETTTRSAFRLTQVPSGITVTGEVAIWRVSKRRYPVAAPNPVSFSPLPLLEADKWSILGSLGISRRSK